MSQNEAKSVKETASQFRYVVPNSVLNDLGTLNGGKLVDILDGFAARVARAHAEKICVTRDEHTEFFSPIDVDETLVIKVAVNRVWNTSMEVGVQVVAIRNRKRVHVATSYLIFVAIDARRKSTPINIPVIPQTATEKRRYREAEKRRQ